MYFRFLVFVLLALFLHSCSIKKTAKYDLEAAEKAIAEAENSKKYVGHYKLGSPYKVSGKTYTPQEHNKYDETGMASWYGIPGGFHGNKTANGDVFNKESLTAAHRTLPMPSLVRVINLDNNKSMVLMVNDRGPFAHKRIIDVSEKAAKFLGFKNQGTAKVRVIYLGDETRDLLRKLALRAVSGKVATGNMHKADCNVTCYLHEINGVDYKQEVVRHKAYEKSPNKKDSYLEAGGFKNIKDARNFVMKMNIRAKNSIVQKGKLYYVSLGPISNKKGSKMMAKKAKSISKVQIKLTEK